MKIALAGNPNSGKTTLFNALTGRSEHVGNWAGVTVEKKEAPVKKQYTAGQELIVVDLPGTYSMAPFTAEEGVTSAYVKGEAPDVIVNIVDATNLSRSLFFTTQLLELDIPVVVALNKTDINEKKNTAIDSAKLGGLLGCPVVETAATAAGHNGLEELVTAALLLPGKGQKAPFHPCNAMPADKKEAEAEDRRRFAFVNELVRQVERRAHKTGDRNGQDRIDAVLTHPLAGIPIFAAVMFLVFQLSQAWLGPWIAEGFVVGQLEVPGLVTVIDLFREWVAQLLAEAGVHAFLAALLTEGILGGFSAVVGFLPLVMVMYFFIALLEDCGYMARATVVLDPIFKKVGLSGKSVIPFVIGTGCAIPGVMACRTIRNERERNAAAMLTPFMPCGAKLPVIALFAGAFFPEAPWVGTLMYFAGIGIVLLGALLVKKITGCKQSAFFIMELPEYKRPSLKRAGKTMLRQGWAYVVKAGTVILICNAVVYIMQSFDWSLQLVEEGMEHTSILATVAQPVAVVLVPVVGVFAWQMAAAALTGFIAKENVVGTLAVCYGISGLIDTEALEMAQGAGAEVAAAFGITKAAALAYLMFNLFTPPCFAAMGAMRAEITDKKWFWGGIALQLATGYTVGYLVYTVGTLLTDPAGLSVAAAMGGGAFVAAFAVVLTWLWIRGDRLQKERK